MTGPMDVTVRDSGALVALHPENTETASFLRTYCRGDGQNGVMWYGGELVVLRGLLSVVLATLWMEGFRVPLTVAEA